MIILCVDGIDPDYAQENGFANLPYQETLTIPKECYILTEKGEEPDTLKVWPTIFSGKTIAYKGSKTPKKRSKPRQLARNFLIKNGLTWGNYEKRFRVNPYNRDIDLVFTPTSFHWNIPTISPEHISTFPNKEEMKTHARREYLQWTAITRGLIGCPYDIAAAYTRIIDVYGHVYPDQLKTIYFDVFNHAKTLAKREPVILISDHGCLNDRHTDHAYIGSTEPLTAESVLDVRANIERIMGEPT
jgi:hypothetical protein